jgi:hypothetical protein
MSSQRRSAKPITVGIPIMSQKIAKDWPKICRLLQQVLNSLANQTVACDRIIIACHERPDISVPEGFKVEYVDVKFPYPKFTWEMELDRLRKLEEIGARHRQHGGGKLFLLDGDDLIDRDFIETAVNSPAKAVIAARGYKLDYANQRLAVLLRFWRRCGSCAVVDWTLDELPEEALGEADSVFRRFVDTRHWDWDSFCAKRGWTTEFINRPAVMYIVNHGQNESDVLAKPTWKWRLYYLLAPQSKLSKEVHDRFGML